MASQHTHAAPGTVVVRAPASSANLGPGFDCLGLALDLWNEVAATEAREPSVVTTDGSPAPGADDNLILRSARTLFDAADALCPTLALRCTNRVPLARGLGSSAAAIASGLVLANAFLPRPWDADALLALAARLEGHPDNVASALLGGVRVSGLGENGQVLQVGVRLAVPLVAAVFVPSVSLSTEEARRALPSTVPFGDALFNTGRASLLVAALAAGETSVLREATRDRLHQPYREPLFPAGPALVDAAIEAGGFGAFVSGAGPSILALCGSARSATAAAEAMHSAARHADVDGTTMVLPLTDRGAHVVDGD